MNRRLARSGMVAIGTIAALVVLSAIALPLGEVVTLETQRPDGQTGETQLWVVDLDGTHYLRGSADSRWLGRVRANPLVRLRHGDADDVDEVEGSDFVAYRAAEVRDPATRAAVQAAMQAKYGFTDRLMGWFGNPERSVILRLEPRPSASSESSMAGNSADGAPSH